MGSLVGQSLGRYQIVEQLAAAVWSRIEIWSAAGGALLHTLEGHADTTSAVRFSPLGDYLASNSEDGTIRICGIRP